MNLRPRRSATRPHPVLLILLVLGACEPIITPLERDPDTVTPEEIFLLSRSAGAVPLPADGITVDTIYARIPRDAASRVVTFETSAGSFLPVPGAKKLEVRAEPDALDEQRLVAKVVLRTDTIATTAVVSGKVNEYIRYLAIPFIH